jgi:hypothetical protein
MTPYRFYTDEFAITVPGSFIDRSATVLEWQTEMGPVTLMIRRRALKEPGEYDALARSYHAELKAGLSAYREETAPDFQCVVPSRVVACRFREEQKVFYHVHILLDFGDKFLIFLWGGEAAQRPVIDDLVRDTMASLLVRETDR